MKKFLAIGGGLIALYILVANGTNSGNLIKSSTSGATSVITAFQGR